MQIMKQTKMLKITPRKNFRMVGNAAETQDTGEAGGIVDGMDAGDIADIGNTEHCGELETLAMLL